MSIEQLAHLDSRESLFLNGIDPQEEEKKDTEKLFHSIDMERIINLFQKD